MITEEQIKDIDFCKNFLTTEIEKMKKEYDSIPADKHISEVKISIIYLNIFASYLQQQKFETLEEAWRFMNDIKGIIEKMFYVNHYIVRIKESMKSSSGK